MENNTRIFTIFKDSVIHNTYLPFLNERQALLSLKWKNQKLSSTGNIKKFRSFHEFNKFMFKVINDTFSKTTFKTVIYNRQ